MFLYKFFQLILYVPYKLIFWTRVKGRKNLVKGGAVLIANHQSYLDIPVLGLNIFKKQSFLAKKELFQKPLSRFLLMRVGAISVDREKVELSTIKQSLKVLKNNGYLTIFPQGTRIVGGKMQNLKNGSLMFSIKSKKPIIPIWIKRPARIFTLNKVIIGEPIYPDSFEGLNNNDLSNEIERQILNFYNSIQDKP